jgi:hypothetical protein
MLVGQHLDLDMRQRKKQDWMERELDAIGQPVVRALK